MDYKLVCLLLGCASTVPIAQPTLAEGGPFPSEFFHAAFARAKTALEEHLPYRLEATLDIAEGRQPFGSVDPLSPLEPVAFMRRSEGKIYLSPAKFEKFCASRLKTARAAEDLAFVLLLHELLHVYQDKVLRTRNARLDPRQLRFFCEGHAVAFAESLARAHRVSEEILAAVRGSVAPRFRGQLEHDRNLLRQHYSYELSARFVRRLGLKVDHFGKLLETKISYPAILGCDLKRLVPSGAAAKQLKVFAKARPDLKLRPVVEIDYFDLCLLLCPPAFDDFALCEGFRGGALTSSTFADGSSADVFLLHFSGGRQQDFVTRLGEYAALCRGEKRTVAGEGAGGRIRHEGYPGRGQSCHIQMAGSLAILVLADDGQASAFVQTCFSSLV